MSELKPKTEGGEEAAKEKEVKEHHHEEAEEESEFDDDESGFVLDLSASVKRSKPESASADEKQTEDSKVSRKQSGRISIADEVRNKFHPFDL